MNLLAYCDGSCPRNGKKDAAGGWAFLVIDRDSGEVLTEQRSQEAVVPATNNTMEATAVLKALKYITEMYGAGQTVEVRSDSQLILKQLFSGWSRNVNRDILSAIDTFLQKHRCTGKHVRGHSGEEYNERVDELAGQAPREHEEKRRARA